MPRIMPQGTDNAVGLSHSRRLLAVDGSPGPEGHPGAGVLTSECVRVLTGSGRCVAQIDRVGGRLWNRREEATR